MKLLVYKRYFGDASHRKVSTIFRAFPSLSRDTNRKCIVEEQTNKIVTQANVEGKSSRKYATPRFRTNCNHTTLENTIRNLNRSLYIPSERFSSFQGGYRDVMFLNRCEKKKRLAELLSRRMKKLSTGLNTKTKENWCLEQTGNENRSLLYRKAINMRKGTGGYEPLPRQSNKDDVKEEQREKKPSNKKTSSSTQKPSEPQHRRRIVSYDEDGNIIFERDLQPGEDSTVALEEWNEERISLQNTVAEAMNPELDWVQNNVEEKEEQQLTTVSKKIPKWIADDVNFDDRDEETEEDEEETSATTDDDEFSSSKDELEEEEAI